MAIADMIPTMADADLVALKANATRIEATGSGAQQKAAAALLPQIEAEMTERAARAPKPAAKVVRARKPKAVTKPVEEPA